MRLPFSKLSGAGNDFVLVEAGRASGAALPRLARELCDRRSGVGADGLLVLGRGSLPRLRYLNADGSAAFCGNGSRCAAWWAFSQGWTRGRREFSLLTSRGELGARVTAPGRVAVRMPPPKRLRLGLKLRAAGRTLTAHAVDTGVPHAVVEVPDLEGLDVEGLGRALRRHRAFAPGGANADFVRLGGGRISLRTYERGVEGETLACGTGAVAAAVVAEALGRTRLPVRVRVRSGDVLTVSRRPPGPPWLEGPARIVFTGEVVR